LTVGIGRRENGRMAGAFDMVGDEWPCDEGWPYADGDDELDPLDVDAEFDEDLVSLHVFAPHLLDGLTPLEQQVVGARFGLGGQQVQSMRELQQVLGLPRADLRTALGDGLAKVRTHLTPS
jgi:hypothetical protein